MIRLQVKIQGTQPLLMHAPITVDTLSKEAKAMKAISSKRVKADADIEELRKLEWIAGLYFDHKKGPYLPGPNLQRMLRDAGALTKQGKAVQRGLECPSAINPLLFDGPRTVAELYGDGNTDFVDARVVVNPGNKARIIRCRPIFYEWGVEFPLAFDERLFNLDQVQEILNKGGDLIGLGDFRPMFGQFEVLSCKTV